VAAGLAASGCNGGSATSDEQRLLSDTAGTKKVQINREVLDEMIQTLPQPIEIAGIISKSNMPFSKEMLVPSEYAGGYKDMYYQSLAFGAYGVDLGYINLNQDNMYALEYLESIKTLSEDIKVDQFFDFFTMAEMAKNRNNADSLAHISTRNFNKIDGFLREQNRGELSVLILIGAWLEGMHVFGEINKNSPSQDIQTRIGEQKVVFDNVYALLDKLSSIDHFSKMKTDFEGLKKAYDGVTVSYIYKQPEMKEVNGELVVVDQSETKVTIDPPTVDSIIASVNTIRTNYILKAQK
jgi:hypothetical protein